MSEDAEVAMLLSEMAGIAAIRRVKMKVSIREQSAGVWIAKALRGGFAIKAIEDGKLAALRSLYQFILKGKA